MTEPEQSAIRSTILETEKEMKAISYRRAQLNQEAQELDQIYMGLWKFKNLQERKLIKPKIIRTRGPKEEPLLTPLDEATKLLEKLSSEQIRELLAELGGSEEEGKAIEYKDREVVHLVEEGE